MTESDWKWEKKGRLWKEMSSVKVDLKGPWKYCWDIASGYISTDYSKGKVVDKGTVGKKCECLDSFMCLVPLLFKSRLRF